MLGYGWLNIAKTTTVEDSNQEQNWDTAAKTGWMVEQLHGQLVDWLGGGNGESHVGFVGWLADVHVVSARYQALLVDITS